MLQRSRIKHEFKGASAAMTGKPVYNLGYSLRPSPSDPIVVPKSRLLIPVLGKREPLGSMQARFDKLHRRHGQQMRFPQKRI
eukprot:325779-Pelagomonas_calceolata.AAC.1